MERIVVGMDNSDGAAAALRWAVREGKVRDWPVTAILAYSYLDQLAVCGLPVDALVDASDQAGLLAAGARGSGGFVGLLVGAVSNQCVQKARCPVAVVREPEDPTGHTVDHIVVGVDGSAGAKAALDWALDTARAHHAVVEVVHAWQPPALVGMYVGTSFDPAPLEIAARQMLDATVDAADTEDVVVKRSLVRGGAAPALLDAARDADLVVIGSRGLGRVKSLLLGSVSHQVVQHAPGPVVVVPTDR